MTRRELLATPAALALDPAKVVLEREPERETIIRDVHWLLRDGVLYYPDRNLDQRGAVSPRYLPQLFSERFGYHRLNLPYRVGTASDARWFQGFDPCCEESRYIAAFDYNTLKWTYHRLTPEDIRCAGVKTTQLIVSHNGPLPSRLEVGQVWDWAIHRVETMGGWFMPPMLPRARA